MVFGCSVTAMLTPTLHTAGDGANVGSWFDQYNESKPWNPLQKSSIADHVILL